MKFLLCPNQLTAVVKKLFPFIGPLHIKQNKENTTSKDQGKLQKLRAQTLYSNIKIAVWINAWIVTTYEICG